MRGEVISVLSLERRYHILSRVSAANEGQNDIVTRAIKLILPSLECDNLFITYLCLYIYIPYNLAVKNTNFNKSLHGCLSK